MFYRVQAHRRVQLRGINDAACTKEHPPMMQRTVNPCLMTETTLNFGRISKRLPRNSSDQLSFVFFCAPETLKSPQPLETDPMLH
jgi:hypothetical protein